ncbi:MAG TPA: sigma-70 family RNA polymerase sigma factor [Chitinophaga sp.]|uniref:sigma-70 family RNA polymerase sigma factor n=1 Tax=Chitinophaga sp. TaxID=1869181 RepID=UPI002C4DEF9F|nr:sigma-70 family RNA polymerase sigma factor [Chitinophaga sp.]HVI44637.1 sigma-70 family RNA polymerase sigma factor [Chitinophaga sp.]
MKDYQKRLFPYAYNILGSSEDAKDAIQDVLSNFYTTEKEGIENEENYLIRSVINQSINMRKKRRKLQYGEVWLPEPVATDTADTNINMRDIVSYSMLVLLEQLNPRERAVFILKEAFGYSHEEIAVSLSCTVENSRKLLSRAKSKIKLDKQPVKLLNSASRGVLENYISAIRSGDVHRVESMLSKDITFFADGGPNLNVVKKICTGAADVANLLALVYQTYQTTQVVEIAEINHQPAFLYYKEGQLAVCQVFELSADNTIARINNVIDPEKLKRLDFI